MSFEKIIKSIETLPPLSDAIIEIQKIYSAGSDNIKILELIKAIESDAILAVNILKKANSPIYGFSKKISSISQAVTLFGIRQIRSFIMSYAIENSIKVDMKVYGITNDRFNDMCNLQSALVIQWFSKIDLGTVNFIAPLALIMESGKLILANEILNSNYKDEFIVGLKECEDISEYEYILFDINSYELSSVLFSYWHLDSIYVNVLTEKTENIDETLLLYKNILKVVNTAINVKGLLTKKSVLKACRIVKEMNLDVEHFVKACVRTKGIYTKDLKKKSLMR